MRQLTTVWSLGVLLLSIPGAAGEEVLYGRDFATCAYQPITEASLAPWKLQGWQVEAEALPEGWSPMDKEGVLKVIGDSEGKRFLRFRGALTGGTVATPRGGWIIPQVTVRNGGAAFLAITYGGPKGGFLGTYGLLRAESGPEWSGVTGVYHFSNPEVSAAVLELVAQELVDVRGLTVLSASGAMDAYGRAYPLIRQPLTNLVKNGGFEKTRTLLPEEVRQWRDEKKWDLGPGDKLVLPEGFGPHPYWQGQHLRAVEDLRKSHSGNRSVEFTILAGGGFPVKPNKVYLFNLWARGEGKLGAMANCYGGPQGGFVGNAPITPSGGWPLTSEWQNFRVVVPLRIKGYEELGVNLVFMGGDKLVQIDDLSASELDTPESLLPKVLKARKGLEETLADQVEVGSRQREMIGFLLAETTQLRERLSAEKALADLAELTDRVAALAYVVPRVKSEIEFGDVKE